MSRKVRAERGLVMVLNHPVQAASARAMMSPAWARFVTRVALSVPVTIVARAIPEAESQGSKEAIPDRCRVVVGRSQWSAPLQAIYLLLRTLFLVGNKWLLLAPSGTSVLAGLVCRCLFRPYVVYVAANEAVLVGMGEGRKGYRTLRSFSNRFVIDGAELVIRRGNAALVGERLTSSSLSAPSVLSLPQYCRSHKFVERRVLQEVLFVGALHSRKGVTEAIQAVQELRRRSGQAVNLSIVGTGPLEAELRVATRQYPFIRLLGFVTDEERLCTIYQRADVLVLLSQSEGQPRVLTEAGLHSCALITTPLPGIISTMGRGVRFAEDVSSLSDVLVKLSGGDLARASAAAFHAAIDDINRSDISFRALSMWIRSSDK